MGQALAAACLAAGHRLTIVSGPVALSYPAAAEVVWVISTEEMLAACQRVFPGCDGLIGAAAPCDYRPAQVAPGKISKTGGTLSLELVETPDILATLSAERKHQWMVAFALETDDARRKAVEKLRRKGCDLIVLNGPAAIDAEATAVDVLDPGGRTVGAWTGSKEAVAGELIALIERTFARG